MSNECRAEVRTPAVRRYRSLKYISNLPDNTKKRDPRVLQDQDTSLVLLDARSLFFE